MNLQASELECEVKFLIEVMFFAMLTRALESLRSSGLVDDRPLEAIPSVISLRCTKLHSIQLRSSLESSFPFSLLTRLAASLRHQS